MAIVKNVQDLRIQRKRKTIRWVLPKDTPEDLMSGLGSSKFLTNGRYVIPMYINPSSIGTTYNKIIQEVQTKGGFVVQYWGEKNVTLQIQGTTGSSGIEGIYVLERIYRHEQYEFERILSRRMKVAKERIKDEALRQSQNLNNIQFSQRESLSAKIFQAGDGLNTIADVFCESTGSKPEIIGKIDTQESLGSLATQVEMHHDGLIFTGYFTNFSYNETANEPGLFTYTLGFTILKSEGKRDNFAKWHRSPYSSGGQDPASAIFAQNVGFAEGDVRQSSTPMDDASSWNLTFPISNYTFPSQTVRDISASLDGAASSFPTTNNNQTPVSLVKPVTRR